MFMYVLMFVNFRSSSVAEVNSSSDCTPSTRPRVQFSGVEDTVEKKTKLKSRKSAKSNVSLFSVTPNPSVSSDLTSNLVYRYHWMPWRCHQTL